MAEKKAFQSPGWFRLDNAATIFPGQNTKTWSNIFRFSIQLKEQVDPELLQQAVKNVLPRFPGFDVRIRRGLFWYYFEKNPVDAPKVMPDIKNPCHRVKFKENDGFLFRVYYHNCRIAVDLYHALSDGHGCSLLGCTIVAEYLRLRGYEIPSGGMVLDLNEAPSVSEMEDSFAANANSKGKIKRSDNYVYHARGKKLPRHMLNITSGTIPFDDLHRLAKEKGVTITEYLAAVLLEVHYKKQLREKKKQKEVAVQIPIDLRRVYGSETHRNFTICLRVKIDPNLGEYTFDELLRTTSLQLRLANDVKKLNAMITANMAIERNPLLRFMPLSVKNLGVGISFLITGEQTTTVLLSNLGPVYVPPQMEQHIEKVLLMPGPAIRNAVRCGVATVNNNLVFTFSGIYEEHDIERDFFRALVKKGLHVKIESNIE